MKPKLILILLALALTPSAIAQENEIINLKIEARADYMREYQSGEKINDNSGFKGRFFNIRMDGNLTKGLSYSIRYRLNRPNIDESYFNATDWLTLTYKTRHWEFSTGKQVVAIGGYEYDRAPIDLYFCSEYWNNIACYQFGLSTAYITESKRDKFLLQFCESPFKKGELNTSNKEMFAYNLMWYGSHDWFNTMYSLNMIEYMPGRFINYIVLGNQFNFGNFRMQLDIMNRSCDISNLLFKDISVMSELTWHAHDCLNVIAKCTYDTNRTKDFGDLCVRPGTDIMRAGIGLEFFPMKSYKDLRMHLNVCHTDGRSPASAALQNAQTIIDAGITWKASLLNLKKRN